MDSVKTRIGKDVIESLTLGMYEDCRFVYREYIQNAADQIDKALELEWLSDLNEGRIEIEVDVANRTISIYDNGTGIAAAEVEPILKNIAQSTKDRSKNKGFRGIGRLGGLAYCDKLTFETSYRGEDIKSTLTWDAQKLKTIINDRSQREEASAVIDAVTQLSTQQEKAEEVYFNVTLHGVSNELLLDKHGIYEYLSMVAPVPYSKGFIFKSELYEKAQAQQDKIDEYPIYINNNQVFKAYTKSIYEGEADNKKKIDDIHNIEFFEAKTAKGELIAWGWYSISNFTKQIPKVNIARGLRMRKGNIQIGLENCLVKLFKESRGSFYFFGEVHAVHEDLIPNARRDYFLDNEILFRLENELRTLFVDLHKLYHVASKIRNDKKKVDDFVSFSKEYEEKVTKVGVSDDVEFAKYSKTFEAKKEKAEQAERRLNRMAERVAQEDTAEKKIFEEIVGEKDTTPQVEDVTINPYEIKPKYAVDDLDRLNRKNKKLVSRIFGVIDKALPKDLANIVKEKIKEELQ